ncbi:uncharacterized protein EI90DRAFT_3055734 [Cantharellus anzutake]|uniref:uncharacterized protein n=1 Tax=Cantharellus anzutake TaxID=1750568 RepID=UPI0019061228|nr:uncharacterized protein EI90DRAFT_3055734 [Cantharellus anzutake]KAF8331880.1 hypothetical protein EI90DRAFT_3055734 [Cantharellus anzutake]
MYKVMFSYLLLSLAALAPFTLVGASPTELSGRARTQGCDLTHVRLNDLPAGQNSVTIRSSAVPKIVTIGAGVQNYTCINNVYVSTGAVAELFDISCIAGTKAFRNIQNFAVDHPTGSELGHQFFGGQTINPVVHHYFDFNPVSPGIAPRFDLAGTNRFTTLKKLGNIPSPQGKANVDWLELSEIKGDLAKFVYRTDTIRGQPPASCIDGSPVISIDYAAKYWFFDSN